MRSVILYCAHLGRDISELQRRVPNVEIYHGERTEKGEDGCLQSHQAIVADAQRRGDASVFVMEDDCQFTKEFVYKTWCERAEWAQAAGYDVMVGGCVQTYNPRVIENDEWMFDRLIDVSAFHSAHCIVYFESGYSKIAKTVQPYDLSVGQVGCRVVMTYPFVAVQRPAFSGILQRDVNYVPLYEQYEMHLGKALGLRA